MERFNKFVDDAKKIHDNKYDYSNSDYKNAKTNIKIICPEHGEFEQRPDNHLAGKGCKKCGIEKLTKLFKKDVNDFINKSNHIHNNKYNYDKVEYKNDATKVCIICPEHGSFYQSPNKHLLGRGCPLCKTKNTIETKMKKYSQYFLDKSKDLHNSKYDYSKSDYIKAKANISIICPIHGEFKQRPDNHLSGKGCPKCFQSNGENKVENYLKINNIEYETQKKFNDCKNKNKLPFDFWLPKLNLIIEFDGEHHFNSIKRFGGDSKLQYTKFCDKIKNEYCIKNNIHLVRISYKDIKNIDEILSKIII